MVESHVVFLTSRKLSLWLCNHSLKTTKAQWATRGSQPSIQSKRNRHYGNIKLLSADALNLVTCKILLFGKGLNLGLCGKEFNKHFPYFFSSPEHKVLMVSFCDHPMSVVRRLSCVVRRPQFLFPHNDTFWRPWETSLLKTLWEKEKLLITSNISLSHSVFYPFGWLSFFFIKFEIVICKLFQFGRV